MDRAESAYVGPKSSKFLPSWSQLQRWRRSTGELECGAQKMGQLFPGLHYGRIDENPAAYGFSLLVELHVLWWYSPFSWSRDRLLKEVVGVVDQHVIRERTLAVIVGMRVPPGATTVVFSPVHWNLQIASCDNVTQISLLCTKDLHTIISIQLSVTHRKSNLRRAAKIRRQAGHGIFSASTHPVVRYGQDESKFPGVRSR